MATNFLSAYNTTIKNQSIDNIWKTHSFNCDIQVISSISLKHLDSVIEPKKTSLQLDYPMKDSSKAETVLHYCHIPLWKGQLVIK